MKLNEYNLQSYKTRNKFDVVLKYALYMKFFMH